MNAMRLSLSCLALLAAGLAGCEANTQQARVAPGPFWVATGVQTGSDVPAWHLLPTGSLAEAPIPRGQREAYAQTIFTAGAFTDYTYDSQPIGIPNGYGYRYRHVVRQGITVP